MTVPHVLLLVSVEGLGSFAQAVCEILSQRYGVTNSQVRSAAVPADRLLSTAAAKDVPVLYVILGPSTSSTSILEMESSVPIITLKTEDASETALSIAKCCSLASEELRAKVQSAVFCNRQARLVQDAQWRTQSPLYAHAIADCFRRDLQVTGDNVDVEGRLRGKVRDRYFGPKNLALVTTDRQSGFDRQLAQVPFKGAVLNLTSAFWFEATKHIIPNHLLSVPHPYVSIVKKCKPFPIEFVVR
jgi:hypothetical protein